MFAPRNFKILRKSGNEVLALFFSLIFHFPPKVKAAIQDRKKILWSFKKFFISKLLLKIKFGDKFTHNLVKRRIETLNLKKLKNKSLLSNEVAVSASKIARDKKIRSIVHKFQQKCAYNPPKKYKGSVLDGRDIITVQVKDAMFKFFITANIKTRAKRRFNEYKELNKKITYNEVLKSLRKRDKSDKERKYGPLKKTKNSILINTTKLSKKACFKKIKSIIDRKIN